MLLFGQVPDVYVVVSSDFTLFVTGKKRELSIDVTDSYIQSDCGSSATACAPQFVVVCQETQFLHQGWW